MKKKWIGVTILLLAGCFQTSIVNAWTMQGRIWIGSLHTSIKSTTTAWQEENEGLYGFGVNARIKLGSTTVAFNPVPRCPSVFLFGIEFRCRALAVENFPTRNCAYCGSGQAQIHDGSELTGPVREWGGTGQDCVINSWGNLF